ncbi:hypothetical protein ACHQM5_028540 [Ranunculus cassubicifolius]
MAGEELDSNWASSTTDSFKDCFNLRMGEGNPTTVRPVMEVSNVVPKPPRLPSSKTFSGPSFPRRSLFSDHAPRELKDSWDRLFKEGYESDVHIVTDDRTIIPAHSTVLGIVSPVLRNFLQQAKLKDGIRYISILGVPSEAVYTFVRFLYSSCYEEEDMKKYALHFLVLSHSFSVPTLKRVCINKLEQIWLTTENVIDILQLAKHCDAPRLSLICSRIIANDFKTVSATEGWKVMTRVDTPLEQEILESIVEADSRRHEKQRKIEEKKMYVQLHEAMEALLHICKDGCRTIGPSHKVPKGGQIACNFPACKGLETLVRHFSICKIRVPGGCAHCKRMWQFLELHSSMCSEPDSCKVPLCGHLKEKMQHQSKYNEIKWRMLVSKVVSAKNSLGLFSALRPRMP